jgi:hypothetical protein
VFQVAYVVAFTIELWWILEAEGLFVLHSFYVDKIVAKMHMA